jgi:hypothetical protein
MCVNAQIGVELLDRRLLQAREQDLARIRGRAEQQNPCHPAPAYGLRDEEYLRLKILTCMLRALKTTPKV